MIHAQQFSDLVIFLETKFLKDAVEVNVGEWQSQAVGGLPHMVSWELEDFSFDWAIPTDPRTLQEQVKPSLPWAEEHFLERVGGVPVNPPPSHERWPHRQKNNEGHMPDGRFSHTYPERFWPKHAQGQVWQAPSNVGVGGEPVPEFTNFSDEEQMARYHEWMVRHGTRVKMKGIRFEYGDLNDVVEQLRLSPQTRQAYLPVWFPEDTGAVHGERVPCTLGYLFKMRGGKLNCTYYIRSCDFMRHFKDDVYMACRLVQWMCDGLDPNRGDDVSWPQPGRLTMHVGSFHIFAGDKPILEHRKQQRIAEALR